MWIAFARDRFAARKLCGQSLSITVAVVRVPNGCDRVGERRLHRIHESMQIPRISLAAVAGCCALALYSGNTANLSLGPDRLVAGEAVRIYDDPPRDAYTRPAPADLLPRPPVDDQRHLDPDPQQWDNARSIVAVVRARALPVYAAVLAVATALQESLLENLTEAVDCDSLGLFQQRPSTGWGTPEELTDPAYAAGAFLDALLARVPNYRSLPLWQAVQAIQASAYPQRYAQWELQAATMVRTILSR